MATYADIFDLRNNEGELRNKIQVAVAFKAHAFLQLPAPTQAQKDWALETLSDPKSKIEEAMWYVFADNRALTVAQITGASDSAIQAAVDTYVDKIIG